MLPYRSIDDYDECIGPLLTWRVFTILGNGNGTRVFFPKKLSFTNARCFRRAKISEEKYYIKIVYRTYAQAEWVSHRCRVRNSAPKTEFPNTLNPYTYTYTTTSFFLANFRNDLRTIPIRPPKRSSPSRTVVREPTATSLVMLNHNASRFMLLFSYTLCDVPIGYTIEIFIDKSYVPYCVYY